MAKKKSEVDTTETPEQEQARLAQEKADAKAAADKAKADAKAEKKAAADAAKAEKAAQKAANASVKQNGVTRPNRGVTLKVWEIADQVSKDTKAPATRKLVTEAGLAAGLEQGTIHTQYGRWRKFNGLTSVRAEPAETK